MAKTYTVAGPDEKVEEIKKLVKEARNKIQVLEKDREIKIWEVLYYALKQYVEYLDKQIEEKQKQQILSQQ